MHTATQLWNSVNEYARIQMFCSIFRSFAPILSLSLSHLLSFILFLLHSNIVCAHNVLHHKRKCDISKGKLFQYNTHSCVHIDIDRIMNANTVNRVHVHFFIRKVILYLPLTLSLDVFLFSVRCCYSFTDRNSETNLYLSPVGEKLMLLDSRFSDESQLSSFSNTFCLKYAPILVDFFVVE